MGEFIDKAKGAANEAMGKAKVAVGRKVDSPDMIIDGAAQEAKGQAQKIVGEAKGLLGDKVYASASYAPITFASGPSPRPLPSNRQHNRKVVLPVFVSTGPIRTGGTETMQRCKRGVVELALPAQ